MYIYHYCPKMNMSNKTNINQTKTFYSAIPVDLPVRRIPVGMDTGRVAFL